MYLNSSAISQNQSYLTKIENRVFQLNLILVILKPLKQNLDLLFYYNDRLEVKLNKHKSKTIEQRYSIIINRRA
jgi:hypothetical protein